MGTDYSVPSSKLLDFARQRESGQRGLSFRFIRLRNVLRFVSRIRAAPFGPSTTQLVEARTRSTWKRSASS